MKQYCTIWGFENSKWHSFFIKNECYNVLYARELFLTDKGETQTLWRSNDNDGAADIYIVYCSPRVPDFLQLNIPVTNSTMEARLIRVIRSAERLLSHIPILTFERSRVRGHMITANPPFFVCTTLNLPSQNWWHITVHLRPNGESGSYIGVRGNCWISLLGYKGKSRRTRVWRKWGKVLCACAGHRQVAVYVK